MIKASCLSIVLLFGLAHSGFSDRNYCLAQESVGKTPGVAGEFELLRAAIQKKLATGDDSVLIGTRVDQVAWDSEKRLVFKGVAWIPEGVERPGLPNDLRSRISKTILLVLSDLRWSEDLRKRRRVVVDGIDGVDIVADKIAVANPLASIRSVISSNSELDGVRIDTAYYDGAGSLTLEGIRANDVQKTILLNALLEKAKDKGSPEWKRWIGVTSEPIIKWSYLLPMTEVRAGLDAAIRRAILSTHPFNAGSDPKQDFHDKVRIDRVFYNEASQFSIIGLRWNELQGSEDAERKGRLRQLIRQELQNGWPNALFTERLSSTDPAKLDELVSVEGVSLFNESKPKYRSAIAYLWDFIPSNPKLDGLRIDRAYYEGGVLHFTGIQSIDGQTEALQKLIDPSHEVWKTLAPSGLKFDSFRIVPTLVYSRACNAA